MFQRLAIILTIFFTAHLLRAADSFTDSVDVTQFEKIAIQHEQTVKTFDTFSRQVLEAITGRGTLDGRPASFTVMDLGFNPKAYADRPIIKIKSLPVRLELRDCLVLTNLMNASEAHRHGAFRIDLAEHLEAARPSSTPCASSSPATTAAPMPSPRSKPPPALSNCSGRAPSCGIFDLIPLQPSATPAKPGPASASYPKKSRTPTAKPNGTQPLAGYDIENLMHVSDAFYSLADAWVKHDAASVNTQLNILASNTLPKIEPSPLSLASTPADRSDL